MLEFGLVTLLLMFLILIGVPIAFSIGGSTLIYILVTNPANVTAIPLRMFSGVNSFTLMALPLFMMAAEIMINTGLSEKLFNLIRLGIGRFRGGLAYVNVLASTVMGSLSGAALSDIGSMGQLEIQAMVDDGYSRPFSCGITAASCIQSPLIPPSNIAILYAGTMSLSVGAMLYGGLLPGLCVALSQIIYIRVNAKKLNLPKHSRTYSAAEKKMLYRDGAVSMLMPLIILVCITFGITTPTEAAAIAVLYALLAGFLYFKNINLSLLTEGIWKTAQSAANLFLIISLSSVFAWALGVEKIPDQLASMLSAVTDNKYVMFLILNLILVVVGMWMETGAAILLFAPILAPVAYKVGIDPLHFAVVMILNLTVGLITPPVGVVLYATAEVGRESFENVTKSTFPYMILGFVVTGFVVFIPEITLFVPRLLGFVQ